MSGCALKRLTLRAWHDESAVLLRVEDTGPGLPPAIAGRIFQSFATTKASGAGLGLGLSIAKHLADVNHFDLTYTSKSGESASFEFRCPVARALGPSETTTSPSGLKGSTLLLVVDAAEELEAAAQELRTLGFLVVTVQTPHEALEIAAAQKLDGVLLQNDLFPISGPVLALEIRRHFDGPIKMLRVGDAPVASGAESCGILSSPFTGELLNQAFGLPTADAPSS